MPRAAVTLHDQVIAECFSIREAERLIELIEPHDPESVHAGDYGIDADEAADVEYQRGPRS